MVVEFGQKTGKKSLISDYIIYLLLSLSFNTCKIILTYMLGCVIIMYFVNIFLITVVWKICKCLMRGGWVKELGGGGGGGEDNGGGVGGGGGSGTW